MHCRILDDNYSWKFIKRHIKLYIYIRSGSSTMFPKFFHQREPSLLDAIESQSFSPILLGFLCPPYWVEVHTQAFSKCKKSCACLHLPRLDYSRHFQRSRKLNNLRLWFCGTFVFHVGMLLEPKRRRIYNLLLRYVKRLKSQTSFLRLNYW